MAQTAHPSEELPIRELIAHLLRRLDTLEWLAMHPGAKPLEDCPGWYVYVEDPEKTNGPFHIIRCYSTPTGETPAIRRSLYTEFMGPHIWGRTFDGVARDELARQGYLAA